ncbi:hypothetical protein SISSUDRAFT_1035451 [Sistotremastrum suecicum HHB10207 ss-3]|uniref:F-box domain-containing protein n=1 Tax=Sistotremastrum suecicum HHB10207 ss-3 TaxID=1314776 RepID=A0A166ARK9_9AGAM|nr:hypothetical protein SISSUDRAFT_1035451 [Sistotremastrum suecicum HHB10207 ss-3]
MDHRMNSIFIPAELCLEMAETLIIVGSKCDLISLSSVDRAWRRTCSPLIWAKSCLVWSRERVPDFADHLVFLAQVASLVKSLTLVSVPHSIENENTLEQEMLRAHGALFVASFEHLSHISSITIDSRGGNANQFIMDELFNAVLSKVKFKSLNVCHILARGQFLADGIAKGIGAFLARHREISDLLLDIPEFNVPIIQTNGHLAYYSSMIRTVPSLTRLHTQAAIAFNGPLQANLRALHLTGTTLSMTDIMRSSNIMFPQLEILSIASGVLYFNSDSLARLARHFPNLQELSWLEAIHHSNMVSDMMFKHQLDNVPPFKFRKINLSVPFSLLPGISLQTLQKALGSLIEYFPDLREVTLAVCRCSLILGLRYTAIRCEFLPDSSTRFINLVGAENRAPPHDFLPGNF